MKTTFDWTEFVIGPRQLRQAAAVKPCRRDNNNVWSAIEAQALDVLRRRGVSSPIFFNRWTGTVWYRTPRDRRVAARLAVAAAATNAP